MPLMSSEVALNQIFNLLQTLVDNENEKKKQKPEEKNNDTLTNLLKGIVEAEKTNAGTSLGKQMQELATGLKAIESINSKKLTEVANSVKTITDIINGISVTNKLSDNIQNLLDNLDELSDIDTQDISKFTSFINTFVTELLKSLQNIDDQDVKKMIKPILDLMSGLSNIISTNVFSMSISLNPIKGKLLGRQIGQFIHAIAKQIKDDKLDKSVKYIKYLTFSDLGGNKKLDKSTYNKNINLIFSKSTAKKIVAFINTLSEAHTDNKKMAEIIAGLLALITSIGSMKKEHVVAFHLFINKLNKKKAKKLNEFFTTLLSGDWDTKKLSTVSSFMSIWNKQILILTGCIIALSLISMLVPFKNILLSSTIIAVFLWMSKKTIISIVKELDKKDIKASASIIKSLNHTLIIITASIVAVSLISKFLSITDVLTSLLILTTALIGTILFIKYLGDKKLNSSIKYAKQAVIAVSVLLLSLTASMLLIRNMVVKTSGIDLVLSFAILAAFAAGSIVIIKQLAEIKSKDLKNASNALLKVGLVFAGISFAINEWLIPVGKHFMPALLGSVLVSAIIAAGIFGISILSKIKNARKAVVNLAILTAIYLGISLISLFILPKIADNATEVMIGAGITLAILGLLIGGVFLLKLIGNRTLTNALKHLAIMAVIYVGIALIAKDIFMPIGQNGKEIGIGAGIVMLIVMSLILDVYLLNIIKGTAAAHALYATAAMAIILLGVSLITKEILIPIGEKAKEAIYGGTIIIGIIIIFGLIMFAFGKILQNKTASNAIINGAIYMTAMSAVIAIIGVCILGFAWTAKKVWEFNKDNAVVFGGLMIVSIIGVMGLIMFAVGKFAEKYASYIITGGVIMAATGALMDIVGLTCLGFAWMAKKVWEFNKDNAVIWGGLLMISILGVMGAIMTAVGAASEALAPLIVVGGIVMIIAGILMDIVGVLILPFAWMAKKVWEFNKDNAVIDGGLLIAEILGGTAIIFSAAAGLLPLLPLIIAGGSILTVVGGFMTILSGVMLIVIGVMSNALKYSVDLIKLAGETMVATFEVMFDVIKAAAPNPKLLIQAAAAGAFAAPCALVFGLLQLLIFLINLVLSTITYDKILQFKQIMLGNGDNDENSLVGSLNAIIKGLSEIDGAYSAALISMAIQPVISTVSEFIDIIIKVATMNYISGYDEKGKPIYSHIPPDAFGTAATVVSEGFSKFLTELNVGMHNLTNGENTKDGVRGGKLSEDTIFWIGMALTPVMDIVSKFVDIILKVSTGSYITGYDERGNPEFGRITPEEFGKAAITVSNNFSYFLTKLNEGFTSLSLWAILAIKVIEKNMGPVMDTVGRFVDMVIKVATMTVVTGYDENGNPEFTTVDTKEFANAGVFVAETFKLFLENLTKAFTHLNILGAAAMDAMKDTLKPVMDSVSSFVDSILKLATGQYIDSYTETEKGNLIPHFTKVESTEYENAAITIAENFSLFIEKLTAVVSKGSSFWGNKTEDALEALEGSIMPVMEGVSAYIEAIMAVATGTYIDHMEPDKDGKLQPYYKKLNVPEDFNKAADAVATNFVTFVVVLTEKLSNETFKKKVENCKKAIEGSITPIMEAVKNYSDALKPFLGLTTNEKDQAALADDYLCARPDFIKNVALNIADSFNTFVDTIYTNLNIHKDDYSKIKDTANDLNTFLTAIGSSFKIFNNIIKQTTNEDGSLKGDATASATFFQNGVDAFKTYFETNNSETFNTKTEAANSCSSFLNIVYTVVKTYKNIIEKLSKAEENGSSTQLIDTLNTNLTKMVNTMNNTTENLNSINYTDLMLLGSTYVNMATSLIKITSIMDAYPNLTTGIDAFLNNMKTLTSPEIVSKLNTGAGSIKLYTLHLDSFTTQIMTTTSKVDIYIETMNKATDAMKAMDDQIISKEQERNKALEELADRINDIADAVDNMRDAFDALDENAIISRFEGLKELLEAAGLVSREDENEVEGNGENTTRREPSQRPVTRRQSRTTSDELVPRTTRTPRTYEQRPQRTYSSGTVHFDFRNYQLSGTYTFTQ